MEPYRFTDSRGRAWDVYDFKIGPDRKRRAVPINHPSSEGRAFVSPDRTTVLIYTFRLVEYRVTEAKFLEDQLRFAKPLNANAAERMSRDV